MQEGHSEEIRGQMESYKKSAGNMKNSSDHEDLLWVSYGLESISFSYDPRKIICSQDLSDLQIGKDLRNEGNILNTSFYLKHLLESLLWAMQHIRSVDLAVTSNMKFSLKEFIFLKLNA